MIFYIVIVVQDGAGDGDRTMIGDYDLFSSTPIQQSLVGSLDDVFIFLDEGGRKAGGRSIEGNYESRQLPV